MDNLNVQIWGALGLALIIAETIVPGGVVIFLGISALLVALATYLEWIDSVPVAITCWFILSLFNLLLVRNFFMKYFEGDTTIHNTDEDQDDIGKVVEVVEEIFPYKEGRIRYRDAGWIAQSSEELKAGDKAIIINRKGSKYVVESIKE